MHTPGACAIKSMHPAIILRAHFNGRVQFISADFAAHARVSTLEFTRACAANSAA